ncbi:MAG: DNA mismatch repair endonuclease MutL [Bacteroidales bacterium]|nr:DNA mismatch repair endonuclease MutL [Bacteroidales bacterium]
MADIIQLLPDSVANQIAAGEVILRPASAVKELLENAIDAGATEINLIVKDAGKTLIQVVDNGSGMSERDARMSFERHATSKIRQANDLFAIRTLGFRGEALASIAAIAQVEMKTRRHEDELGTIVEVEGSRVKNQDNCSCPAGTSILVKNLFFNVPARRSFLKTEAAELKHIIDEFFRVALVYPEVRFTFHQNQKPLYQLPPGNRKQRIISLFGSGYNERLVPVEHISDAISITGFVGKPEYARKTRGEQFFFVNGRYIRHPYLHHSIENAYRELIPVESVPSYFIYIDTDPGTIDINIHPTKTEVNFLDSKVIYAVIRSAVRQSLGLHNILDSIDFDVERSLDFTISGVDRPIRNPFDVPPSDFDPFNQHNPQGKTGGESWQKPSVKGWENLYDQNDIQFIPSPREEGLFSDMDLQTGPDDTGKANVFQFQNRYIISSIKSGLVLIDQQRAQERILYERYLDRFRQHQHAVQQELFPCQVSFSLSDASLLDDILEEMSVIGFHLNKLGKNTFVVSGTPAGMPETDIQALLESFLDAYKKNLVEFDLEKTTNLARSLACSLSAKSGRQLFTEEMIHLIDELFSCKAPELTPDGQKVFTIIPLDQIQQMLNR